MERAGFEPAASDLQSQPIARPHLTPTDRIGMTEPYSAFCRTSPDTVRQRSARTALARPVPTWATVVRSSRTGAAVGRGRRSTPSLRRAIDLSVAFFPLAALILLRSGEDQPRGAIDAARGRELHAWHLGGERANDADGTAAGWLMRPRGAYVMGRNRSSAHLWVRLIRFRLQIGRL
jgi:hypothetical protein